MGPYFKHTHTYIWSRVPCSHPPMGWGGVWCPCGGVYTYIHTYIPTYLHTYVHTYHYITLPYLTFHTYIHTMTLHYLTLPYLTLHYLTLPYITFHTYIHTYTDTHTHTYIHTNIPPPQATGGGGPEEPYHHHRPQGGGPEEPYHHHRPQGGDQKNQTILSTHTHWWGGGRGGGQRCTIYILLVASRTLEPMFYPNGSSHWVLPKNGMGSDPSNCQQKRCLLSLNKGLYEYL